MVWQRNYLNFHIMKDPLQPFDTTTSGGFPGAKSGPPTAGPIAQIHRPTSETTNKYGPGGLGFYSTNGRG
jgi:hypothetical protein